MSKTMTAFSVPTMNALHDQLTDRLLWSSRDQLSMVTSVDTQLHNVMVRAEAMDWQFNFKDLWIGKSRWSAMTNQYIDRDSLDLFVEGCGEKLTRGKRGVAMMRTRTVAGGHSSGGKTWRRWGGCMLAIGYRSMPRPQITLHSRTSYLGYIGAMDLTVVHCVAREIADAVGLDVEDISFVWHLEAAQYHGFKSLAYMLGNPTRRARYEELVGVEYVDEPNTLREDYPAVLMHKKWLATFQREDDSGLTYGDMKFGQTRRIRKRKHTELDGIDPANNPWSGGDHTVKSQRYAFKPLPDLWSDDLNLKRVARGREDLGAEVEIDTDGEG